MAAVERIPAGDRAQSAREERQGREEERGQAAQDQGRRLTGRWGRRAAALIAALAAGGCAVTDRAAPLTDAPQPPAAVPFTSAAPAQPPGSGATSPPAAAGAPDPNVRPAAANQPLPPPRPLANADSVGQALPPAPKALPPLLGSPVSQGGALRLDEVLQSVERHYPLLRAVEQERAVAGGRLLTAMGFFDLNLTAGTEGQGTTYDNIRNRVGISQGIPIAGLGVFAGYRNGFGDFPTYNLGQKTADGGEFQAGITIPLMQNRAIDRPRANIRQAQIDVALAEPVIERQRLDFQRSAARVYWNWVGAGQRLKLARQLIRLATERDEQLKTRVAAGALQQIDRTNNMQQIAFRNGLLVQAQRQFQQATIELSLFLRDEGGRPSLAGADRLPDFPDVLAVDVSAFDSALQTAFELRPEPRRLRLQRDRVAVELEFARNQLLPTLNASVGTAQDAGPGKSSLSGPNGLDRSTVTGALAFALPVQRRDARGRIQAAQAQIVQLDEQLRQAEDVVRAEVQDTFSALERAAEFYKQAKERLVLAEVVAEGERRRLAAGASTIINVTLLEIQAFEAEIGAVNAQQEFFRALADFRAAVGIGAK